MRESSNSNVAAYRPIRKFNPGLLQSDEEVRGQFVVRQNELKVVSDVLIDNIGTPSCQHLMVVAARGQGKTMMLARVAAEIRQNEKLARHFLPVQFMEESQEIFCLADFWLETLFHLARAVSAENAKIAAELSGTHAELSNRWREKNIEGLARAAVLDAADRLGCRLVLMVENMQSLVSTVGSEFGWALRGVLQSFPQIMLVTSATSRFEELDDPHAPFFELFRLVHLEPLATKDCLRLWSEVTGTESCTRSIRPLQILTGGNPRLLVMVATFARHRSLRKLMEELVVVVDEHTDYFRTHLDSLPKHERRVFISLLDLWQASSAGEIAERGRLDIRVVSTMLGRLVERGVVTIELDSDRNKRFYMPSERLYSIFYKLRRERDESAVVEALIHFMVAFYDVEEFARIAAHLKRDALEYPAIEAGIDRALVQRTMSQDRNLCMKWDEIERTSGTIKNKRYTNAVIRLDSDVQSAIEKKDWEGLLGIVAQFEAVGPPDSISEWERQHDQAHIVHLKSNAYLLLKEYSKVIEVASKISEELRDTRDSTLMIRACSLSFNIARACYQLRDFERSKLECDRIIKYYKEHKSPIDDFRIVSALVLLAESENGLGNADRASGLLDGVVNRFGSRDDVDVQRLIARSMVFKGEIAQIRSGNHSRVTKNYSEVINRFGGSKDLLIRIYVISAWLNKGIAFGMVGDFEQEIACYEGLVGWLDERNSMEEKRSAITALVYKSRRLAELGRVEDALVSSEAAAKRIDECLDEFKLETRRWMEWHIEGTRALALMASGASGRAMDMFRSAYVAFEPKDDLSVGEMLRLVPELIAAGASERDLVGALQSDSSGAQRLQPIIVALLQRTGDSVRAPAEVLEVSKDFGKLVNKRMVEGVMPGFVYRMDA